LDTANHAGLKIDKLEKDFPAEPAGLKTEEMEKVFPAKPAGMKIQNSLSATSSSEFASDLRGRGAGSNPSMLATAPRKLHVDDCLELRSIRKTLETLNEEVGHCLERLHLWEDKLMGRSNSLGSSFSRPNFLIPDRPSSTHGPPKLAQLSKDKAPLQFPFKRPKFLFKPKAGSVLRPIPARQFSLDAGASTSAMQSELLGLGSAVSRSACRPGFTGRVYQRRKRRNQSSSAVWRVKLGQPNLDVGTSQVREKEAVSSKIGDQDTSPASEEALGQESRKSCS